MLLFPDSNFFMQCRHPAELSWADITDAGDIRLFVSRTVQGEIDRFKGDGKGRRSDRARAVSSWFAAIIDEGRPYTLRESSPRVTLNLPPRMRPDHAYPPGLDLSRNDDRIVGEALAFPEGGAVLLTDDTNMKLTAREEGLPFIPIPDAWRLPPEADGKDKVIAELQRRLQILERSIPALEISVLSPRARALEMSRTRYERLPRDTIDALMAALRLAAPERTDFSQTAGSGYFGALRSAGLDVVRLTGVEWRPPSDRAIALYKEEYAAWLQGVEKHLARVQRVLPGAYGQAEIELTLRNVGTLPAEGAIVEIMTSGGIALTKPDRLEAPPAHLPGPPDPPEWTMSHGALGDLMDFEAAFRAGTTARGPGLLLGDMVHWPGRHGPPRAQDPYAFHPRHVPGRALGRRWSFGCAEFRHGGATASFKAAVLTVGRRDAGAVRVRVSARNLPVPVEAVLPVRIVMAEGDTEGEARALVEALRRAETLRQSFTASRS